MLFRSGYYTVQYDVWITAAAILDIADYSATITGTILVHALLHGIQTGMKVTIVNTLGKYDGFYSATRIDDNFFYIVAAFNGDDTGTATPCYSTTCTPHVFANAEMAINKMLAIFCNMDEGPQADEYMKQITMLNGLLLALRSAIMTTTSTKVNNIYGRITRILDYNNVELTYT